MLKVEIEMDNQKLIEHGFDLANVYKSLDNSYIRNGLIKVYEAPNMRSYTGANKAEDFAVFGMVNLNLEQEAWFMNHVKKWLWYNSGDSDNPSDFCVDDLLADIAEENKKQS